jgi:hypothetical protein
VFYPKTVKECFLGAGWDGVSSRMQAISNQGRGAKKDGSPIPTVSHDDSTSVDFLGAEQDKQPH